MRLIERIRDWTGEAAQALEPLCLLAGFLYGIVGLLTAAAYASRGWYTIAEKHALLCALLIMACWIARDRGKLLKSKHKRSSANA